MLEIKNLFAGYGNIKIKNRSSAEAGISDVIRNISIKAGNGESLCILGPNGSGKSTLLRAIARIIDYRGKVFLDGCDAASFSRKNFAKKTALLSQTAQVFFPYTVYETVSMGRYAYLQGIFKNLSAEDEAIIEETLKKLDIINIKDSIIDELSGGQLQRVFLARTLAQTPDIILLDEPANHLDLKHQLELLEFLKKWVKENNKTLISVFHDLNLARQFGDTAVILNNGEITASGEIDEVLNCEALSAIYGINIRAYFLQALEKWK